MMKLSTMRKVVETVDSEWRSPLAEEILQRWGYDEGSVYYLRASANFIFIFKREGITYFLRFNESCEKEVEKIEAELKILQYLDNYSLQVAQPVKSLNNKYTEVVETKWGLYYAVVFEALTGKHYDIEELTMEQFYLWGQSLGKLHKSFKQIPEHYLQNRPSWKDQLNIAKGIIPVEEFAAHRELDRIYKWAEELEVTEENYGLIHYDFELDNVLFDQKKIGVIDFDDCTSHWYVADIIYSLRDVDEFNINSPIIKSFIKGYKTETTLDVNLLNNISEFQRMHEIVTYASMIRSVDIEKSSNDSEWLTNLRNKLCNYINSKRDWS